MNHESQDLLQCPFCGSPAEWEYTPWDDDARTGDDGSGWVECAGCKVQMPAGCRDEAVERWNRRDKAAYNAVAAACKARALEVVCWNRNDYNAAQIDPILTALRHAL